MEYKEEEYLFAKRTIKDLELIVPKVIKKHEKAVKIFHRYIRSKDKFVDFPVMEFTVDIKLDMVNTMGLNEFYAFGREIAFSRQFMLKRELDGYAEEVLDAKRLIDTYDKELEIEEKNKKKDNFLHSLIFDEFSEGGTHFIVHSKHDSFRFADAKHLRNTLIKKGISRGELNLESLESILHASSDWGKSFMHVVEMVYGKGIIEMPELIRLFLTPTAAKRIESNFYIATNYKKPVIKNIEELKNKNTLSKDDVIDNSDNDLNDI